MLAVLPYVNEASPAGQRQQPAYVFYAGVAITSAKTVQAVTLPGQSPAQAAGLHIFAVAVGPLAAPGPAAGATD